MYCEGLLHCRLIIGPQTNDLHKLSDTQSILYNIDVSQYHSVLKVKKSQQIKVTSVYVLHKVVTKSSDMLSKSTWDIKKCKVNQKQHCKQAGVTKNFDYQKEPS